MKVKTSRNRFYSGKMPNSVILVLLLLLLTPSLTMAQQVGPIAIVMHTIDDDNSGQSGGNGDGTANAGELIELIVTLRNNGGLAARSVHGSLSVSDNYVFVLDGEEDFPDIAPGGTAIPELDFDFRVDASVPLNHPVRFRLDITADGGGPWTDFLDIVIDPLGPIVLAEVIMNDDNLGESSGNNNGEANAGELIELTLLIRNQGAATVNSLQATLSTLNSYTTLTTSEVNFSSLAGGDTAIADFGFHIDAAAPAGTRIKFDLSISAGNTANWRQSFEMTIEAFIPTNAIATNPSQTIPALYSLEQNYPNPFNAETTIPIAIPFPSEVEVKIHNVFGEEVLILHSGHLQPGRHNLTWNGRSATGSEVSSGVYFVRFYSDQGSHFVRKMISLK